MESNEKLIIKLLDEVEQEYSTRYQWGDTQSECMGLFRKVRSQIQNNISSAYINNPNLSADSVLSIVLSFMDSWPNRSTECDDTDGKIHITSIYSKLEYNLEGVTKPTIVQNQIEIENTKDESLPEPAAIETKVFTSTFIKFYIVFLVILFGIFIYLVE